MGRDRAIELLRYVGIVAIPLAAFAFFSRLSLVHDVAWLLDATGRWLRGAKLYTDIVEINPPLVFYETAALSFGTATGVGYVAGVCALMSLSALWCARAGWREAYAALAAMLIGGFSDFGQRDHLALILVMPYLLVPQGQRRSWLTGVAAFFGVGLKPHLLLIPLLASLATCLQERSWRPLFAGRNWALGVLCVAYIPFVALAHPAYFTEIVPLGRLVYEAYGAVMVSGYQLQIWVLAALATMLVTRPRWRLAGALLGAFAAYLLQAKFWAYHIQPTVGLTLLLALLGLGEARARRIGYVVAAIGIAAVVLANGPYRVRPRPLPSDAQSVAYLTAHVWAAYPQTFENGVRHASRYPALWPLPGAWNIVTDPAETPERRARAEAVLRQTRQNIVDDIVGGRPDYILVHDPRRQQYFNQRFDYWAFIHADPRLAGYVETERRGDWRLFRRSG